jgi:hypothetical protein
VAYCRPMTDADWEEPAWCGLCGWRGRLADASAVMCDVVRCPECNVAVVRESYAPVTARGRWWWLWRVLFGDPRRAS